MVGTKTCGRLFLSYSRKNKEQVYPLATALAQAGIDLWIDRGEIDPLDDFPARIRDGLAHCHALLAWYSPEYAQSSYCQKELAAAWICTQRLTCNTLSRILIVNPEEGIAHIALGDVARQNYLVAPKDPSSLNRFIQSIREKLVGLSGDFAALREFKRPYWHPSSQPGSSRFVGRLQELWDIHTGLNPTGISDHENPSVVVQLTGLGGIGKTLLVIEYAKRFGAAYPGGVHWLRAYGFDPQKAVAHEVRERERQRQIEDLAVCHDIPINDKQFREIHRDLSRKLASGKPYLWIVDDLPPGLDQRQDLPGWCAPSGNGHTLITTRSNEYAGLGITVKTDVLDPVAALELLTQTRKPENEQEWQDAKEMAEDLGRHALALDVTGHFLLVDKGFAALRVDLASIQSDLLGEITAGLEGQLPGGHEKSIVATLLQSVRLLKQEGLNLLRLACELQGGTPIPFRLADKVFGYAFGLDAQSADNYLRRAMNQLRIHSLGTVSLGGVGGDTLSVHALVRYTLRRVDPAPELRERLREAALAALIDLLPGIADIRNHARLELEVAHARHLASKPYTLSEARLCTFVAQFAGARGNYREALEILMEALPVLTRVLGEDHPDTLAAWILVGHWRGENGLPDVALRLHQQVLHDNIRVHGANHRLTLGARGNIVYWTGQVGKPYDALQLARKLLTDQARELGEDHPDTLITRANIAYWTGVNGNPAVALQLYQDLLPVQARVLGEDHQDTLTTRANIAHWTGETGNPAAALKQFQDLLSDQDRVFNKDHPDIFGTRNNIAYETWKNGDSIEALRLARELLPDLMQVLGEDHRYTLITRANIATWTKEIEVQLSDVTQHRHTSQKIGRNAPCPCGSGFKYKRCHGKNR